MTEQILIYHLNFFASLRLCVEAFGFFSRVIFISKEDYELYGWAPIVVFANGAVARARDAGQIIEDDDEILIYYGGGDRVVGVARARLSDLVPKAARRCST